MNTALWVIYQGNIITATGTNKCELNPRLTRTEVTTMSIETWSKIRRLLT